MTSTGFDFTAFAATSRQLDLDLIAFARDLAAAKTIETVRDALAARPGHSAAAALPDGDVYAYAFGVLAAITPKLAGWAEQEIARHA